MVSYHIYTVPGHPPSSSLPVLSIHSSPINLQLLFLNQRKRKNGCRNIFITKSLQKNMLDAGISSGKLDPLEARNTPKKRN